MIVHLVASVRPAVDENCCWCLWTQQLLTAGSEASPERREAAWLTLSTETHTHTHTHTQREWSSATERASVLHLHRTINSLLTHFFTSSSVCKHLGDTGSRRAAPGSFSPETERDAAEIWNCSQLMCVNIVVFNGWTGSMIKTANVCRRTQWTSWWISESGCWSFCRCGCWTADEPSAERTPVHQLRVNTGAAAVTRVLVSVQSPVLQGPAGAQQRYALYWELL